MQAATQSQKNFKNEGIRINPCILNVAIPVVNQLW